MRKRGFLLFIFLLFLGFSVILYFLFQTAIGQRAHGITEAISLPFQRIVVSFYPKSAGEVLALQIENRRLREQLAKKTISEQDSAALRDQFQITTVASRNVLPARIVGMRTFVPGITQPDEITIDKGRNDRVKKGASVIVGESVIGSVTIVSERMAKVTLITAPTSSISVETLGTNALGILRGKGNGTARIENVLLSDTLEKNDSVITKGEKEVKGLGLPRGLIVGKIASVSKKASDLFQSADVENVLQISEITTVFIITSE